jgi:hypothetical protein
MVSRDGCEDIYACAEDYSMEEGDLVFLNVDGVEVGRVVGFGNGEGNAVVEVGEMEDDEEPDADAEVEAALELLEEKAEGNFQAERDVKSLRYQLERTGE